MADWHMHACLGAFLVPFRTCHKTRILNDFRTPEGGVFEGP
jgi:hypothetical protein